MSKNDDKIYQFSHFMHKNSSKPESTVTINSVLLKVNLVHILTANTKRLNRR